MITFLVLFGGWEVAFIDRLLHTVAFTDVFPSLLSARDLGHLLYRRHAPGEEK